MDKCKGPKCVQYNNNAKLLMQVTPLPRNLNHPARLEVALQGVTRRYKKVQAGTKSYYRHVQTRGSKFIKFQEVKVQELPDQVPTGHIPRMMTVHLTGELTRSCGPGDEILISGIFLPMPYTGYKAMKAGLTADTFLEATSVKRAKQRYQDFHITQEMRDQIEACEGESNTYGKLAASIAPEIFGHEDVKKALLLQLVGGVDRSLNDGMRIRGDMHVCLMGDPGVAKSQLLKHVARLAPRGVYTTGKGSSGVGLTAAVTKDQFTGEMMLEGGALVLADQGICCIDEFDKMEDSDRTAIHEFCVSVFRRSRCVLAAANPAYGRYNLRRSPSENINLPQALLSRFDILFLLMDRVNPEMDYNLAKHVTYVHQFKAAPEVDRDAIFDAGFLRAYIAKARSIDPHVPKSLSEYITSAYISMRCDEEPSDSRNYFFTTARTLLSILRLSQALARLRFAQEVASADVDEAIRLMYESKRSLFDEAVPGQRSYDPSSSIFDIARNLAAASDTQVLRVSELETRAVMKGFTAKQLRDCIQTYADLNIWQLEDSDQQLRIV
ncbi:MCM2/3/5 family-domain-containing protein [Baffinella frigidus]|nr:MCM2/3/5 family-domain-containing protein [Cryptophyta sp. CCMP2293]